MLSVAVAAAEAGATVLMEKFGKRIRVDHKGEVDLVTEADQAAEQAIVETISNQFSEHDILAEEGEYTEKGSSHRWIIDPLDGTTNYAHGFPWFAVSIGLEVEGEVVIGVVLNPHNRELYVAEKGAGATLNGKAISVSTVDRLDQSLLATGFPYDRKQSQGNNYENFVNFQQRAQACRRPGAACLDLACTAAGRFEGYWEMKLKPWDVAAGQLLVSEAGGQLSNFGGDRLDIYGNEIVASNGLIHTDMIEILRNGNRP